MPIYLSLLFDDGFRRSCEQIAEIHEEVGLVASFNIVGEGHTMDRSTLDEWQSSVAVGDFDLWRDLAARGHEIMPHGLRHRALPSLDLAEAKASIPECLSIFERELPGFAAERGIFHFPYNASTPALEQWLATRVRAWRTGGGAQNPSPTATTRRITCDASGPGNCEEHLDAAVAALTERGDGWCVYNLHGLDAEGWGPIGSNYLRERLARWTQIPGLQVLPPGAVLDRAGVPASASGFAEPHRA